jgi:CrcB protein
MMYVVISIGAVAGANLRFIVGNWISDTFGSTFPLATLAINVTGSFILGLFLTLIGEKLVVAWWWRPLVAVGFLGSYTTFSTFSYETVALARDGSVIAAGANIVASVGAALIGVYLGMELARAT